MIAHILGNGPSIKLYEDAPWGDFIIGCNFQQHRVDVNIVLDCRPFMIYKGNRDLLPNKVLITSKYAWPTILEQGLEKEFKIASMVQVLEKYKSAGHYAVEYAIDHDYSEIHLWGFDSIWEDTQETRTDEIVPRNRAQFDLWMHWRERWKNYTQHNIIVHNTKEGTPLRELL